MNPQHFVVVGGSSGIGLGITRALSAAGHAVSVFSRNPGESDGLAGVTHFPLDITREEIDPAALPGTIRGMAYCPGSIRLRPFHRLMPNDFLADVEINLIGAVKSIQACLKGLKKSTDASSIVLFSTVAVQTGMPFHAAVASAKGAVEGLVRSLAAELAPRVRVNAVAPSLTDTPLANALLADDNKQSAAAERHPLKRVGRAEDIAAAAVFLLSNAAAWVTGQVIAVDGGMGALRTFK
jgi:NAD(P)-dependent dehydrogenase (short-subunit alcohol dehydrogenase family)